MKLSHTIVIILLVLFFSNYGFSQDQKFADSISNIVNSQKGSEQVASYRRLFRHYYLVDTKVAKKYLDSSKASAKRYKNKSFIAQTINDEAIYFTKISEYKKAVSNFDNALVIFQELDDNEQINVTLNNKALALGHLGRYNEALEAHIQSLELKRKLKQEDPDNLSADYWDESIAASFWNLGNLHGDLKNYEKSNEYYEKAQRIYKRLNLEDDLDLVNGNIAINLKLLGRYDEAIPIFLNSITFLKAQNYNNDLAATYDNLGMTYFEMDSLENAKDYITKAIALSSNFEDKSLMALAKRHLGDIYMKEGQFNQALNLYEQSLKTSQETGTRKVMIQDYLGISKAHAALGNYKLAFENYNTHNALYKEILGQETIDKINELEIRYDTETKEKDLIIEKDKVELLKSEAKVNGLQRWLLGSGLVLSLFVLGFAIFGFKQKSKRAKLEKEKVDAELAFKKKELTTHALHLAKKNEMLEGLKQKANALKSSENVQNGYQQLIRTIDFDLKDDNNWENFANYFQQVHKDFNQKVTNKYPEVTPNELRLISLVKMNLSIKEMANILNISVAGVKKARQRLRKKMNLSTNDSLEIAVLSI